MNSFLNTSEKVVEIAKSLTPESITWAKWSNLIDQIQKLKESGQEDEAWNLLFQTALQDNPEASTSIIV